MVVCRLSLVCCSSRSSSSTLLPRRFDTAGLTAFFRFAFPAVCSEREAFWIIKVSPISIRSFLWIKFSIYFLPLLILTEILIVVTNTLLNVDPFMMGLSVLTVFAMLLEPLPDFTAMRPETLYSLAYVLAFPMIFCQWAYFKSVRLFPASLAAISTLGIPLVGTFSSALILDEQVGMREFGALALVVSALAAVLLLPALKRR